MPSDPSKVMRQKLFYAEIYGPYISGMLHIRHHRFQSATLFHCNLPLSKAPKLSTNSFDCSGQKCYCNSIEGDDADNCVWNASM